MVLYKKASTFLKKDMSTDILLLQTRRKNNSNVLTGSLSVAEDRFPRPQDHGNAELDAAEVKRQFVTAYRRVSHGLGWPANAILFLPSLKGNQKLRNTSAPTASNIAHQTN